MLRGTRLFVCDNCGHKFKGMDIEWNATVMSQPQRCPECGSYHTYPKSIFGFNKFFYRDIWKFMDELHQKQP
jgi:DNA-directed RNA polymerase subunit RPC12/RpoP